MRIAYIASVGHSGSTLLDVLLSEHSKIFGMGEVAHINARAGHMCTCGSKRSTCSFWKDVHVPTVPMHIGRTKWDFIRGVDSYFSVSTREPIVANAYAREHSGFFVQVLRHSGAEMLVDSSKNTHRIELLSRRSTTRPLCIHLIRDSRAVTWSYVRKYRRVLPFLFKWMLFNLKIEIIKRRSSAEWVTLRYKDLATNPENALRKILQKTDLDYENGMVSLEMRDQHQFGGNRMRFQIHQDVVFDTRWEREMPLWLKVFVTATSWPLMVYYRSV